MPFVKSQDSQQGIGSKLDTWRHLMNDAFGPIEVHPSPEGKFSGSVRTAKRADLQFNELSYSGQILERTSRNADKLGQEYYTFGRPTSGPLYIKKKNIEYVLEPGCIYLTDQSVPYMAQAKDIPYQSISISIPRSALALREPRLSPFYTLQLGDENPRAQLLSGYMDQLMAGLFHWSDVEVSGLANKLLDMIVVLMVHEERSLTSGTEQNVRQAQHECAMTYIRSHCHNPALSAAQVAASCGLSVNYIEALFRSTQLSIEESIYNERLTKGHELLSSAMHRGKSVSQLAYQAGFNHAGHFSRLFKDRFGISPNDFRKQAASTWNLRASTKN
ncbi:MAG: helix-turn-helix domain-containing protein [Burkholderiaceae bacterium]